MNQTEIGVLIHQVFVDIKDREVQVADGGEMPDGTYILVVKIDGKTFNITVEEEK